MTVCKKFRDGAELHMVVAMSDDRLFQNWYSVIEDDAGIQHPSSTAGYFDSLDQAVAMMKKHRPNAKEVFTMTKQIKKDEGIRLADGRMATLSAAQLPDGKFEVMLFTNGPEMEEVDSIQCEYEETALAHFERLKKYYHMTGPGSESQQPCREWVERIVDDVKNELSPFYPIPVFMKGNLRKVWGRDLIQEFPEKLEAQG